MGIDTSNPEVQPLKLAVCLFFGRTKNTAAKLRLLRQLCRFGGLVPATPQQLGCKFGGSLDTPCPQTNAGKMGEGLQNSAPCRWICNLFLHQKIVSSVSIWKSEKFQLLLNLEISGGSPSWRWKENSSFFFVGKFSPNEATKKGGNFFQEGCLQVKESRVVWKC